MKTLVSFLGIIIALGAPAFAQSQTKPKPTIIVFLSDDHGMLDSTPYGSTEVRTPNMQRLADSGMTFTHAFIASPACAPSRTAMLTGLMPARNGAENNHTFKRDDVASLPNVMRKLGYETAAFGKVAHGGKDVQRHGFDVFNEQHDAAFVGKFLQERDASKPLCLFVGTHEPHVPWADVAGYDPAKMTLPPKFVDTPETREHRARYYTDVTKADADLGEVLDLAKEHFDPANTLFIYTSDHGGQWPFGKWNLYDTSTRVPFLAAWPGVIAPGSRTGALVQWIDLWPTLIEAAGGTVPAGIDGRSFLPVVRGGKSTHREVIFTTHSGDGAMNVYPIRAMRDGDWKFILNLHPEFAHTTHIDKSPNVRSGLTYWKSWFEKAKTESAAAGIVKRYHERPAVELYDLRADPAELCNLAADPAQSARVKEIRARLEAWMREQGDKETVFSTPRLLTDPASIVPATEEAPAAVPARKGGRKASAAPAPRPNIVFILVDDMGWGDLSCFGNREAQTPNIDRLASEGIRFSQFHVNSPICSPSRCALTTGQYPQRWRITSFLNNRADNERRGVAQWLDPKAPTLARILQQKGYATGHFGKWHLGGQRDVADAPPITAYGFDESLTNFEGMGAKLLPLTMKPGDKEPGRIWADAERLGQPVKWMQRSKITSGFIDAAIPFINDAAAAKKPFFVNLWPDDVHGPWWPPVEKWGKSKREMYLAVLEEMDRQFGKLFDHLRDTPALRDNTLILICSDNGPEPGAGRAGPFRGSKATLYEGGTRSPLIAWGPGLIERSKAGSKNETSVFAAFDLAPSLLAIANIARPAAVAFDGENLAPVLLGQSTASRSAPIFWRRPPDRKTISPALPERLPDLAVREGDWKFLCEYDGSKPQLYNLATDRGETANLATQHPGIVARLTNAVLTWHDSMPPDNGPALGAEQAKANGQAVDRKKPAAKASAAEQ